MYFFTEDYTRDEVHHLLFPYWNMCAPERFTVDPFSIADAKYIAKYSLKTPHVKFDGIEPVFSLSSKVPAIGASFLSSPAAKQLSVNQSTQVFDSGGTSYALPRYYKDKLFTPLEKRNILDEYRSRDLFYKTLGTNDIQALSHIEEDAYLRGINIERYKVMTVAIDDFGKDCKVTYRQYKQNIDF